MDAGRIRHFADYRFGVQVDDDNLGGVGDIEPSRGRVDREIVPPAFATYGNVFLEHVRTVGGPDFGGGGGPEGAEEENASEAVGARVHGRGLEIK